MITDDAFSRKPKKIEPVPTTIEKCPIKSIAVDEILIRLEMKEAKKIKRDKGVKK